MDENERRRAVSLARFMWGGFYRCPTTGRILTALQGDDKALCSCGLANPRVPEERTERTGVHIVRFLSAATAEEFVDQEVAEGRLKEGVTNGVE